MKKAKKIIIITIISITVLLIFGGNYFYNIALSSKSDKTSINSQDGKTIHPPQELEWFKKNAQKVSINSYLKFKLTGYEFTHKDKKDLPFVICVHGYGGNATKMTRFIKGFYDRGYNVLAMDLIGHGNSEGNFISMGGSDSKDLKNWINFLDEKYQNPRILLFGISMGAATVLNTLDENLPSNVKGFIEDCGYLKLEDEFSYQMKKLYHLPKYPLIPVASIVTKIRAGYLFSEVDATEALKNTTLPGLIIHGDSDTYVPPENAQKIYDLAGGEKEILIVKGATHAKASLQDSKLYWASVDKFLDKYFKLKDDK